MVEQTELPLRLNCTACHAFREYDRDGNVATCAECGKRHSTDSLYAVVPGISYERSESGALLEDPP